MAYRNLQIAAGPPHCQRLARHIEDHYLRDVPAMFRLPIPNYGITAGCNFAIAQTLLAVISGLSVTSYHGATGSGDRFKGLLVDHYPWQLEPRSAIVDSAAAEQIYEVFRNPLTHDLGLDTEKKADTAIVKAKRYTRLNGLRGLTEREIERREDSTVRPSISGTVIKDAASTVLLLDALYWATRVMIEDMLQSPAVTTIAEAYLASL